MSVGEWRDPGPSVALAATVVRGVRGRRGWRIDAESVWLYVDECGRGGRLVPFQDTGTV